MAGIDTSIYGMLGQGVTPIKDLVTSDMQKMQLRHMAAQTTALEGQAQDAVALKQAAAKVQARAAAENRQPTPQEYEAEFRAIGTPGAIKAAHESEQARFATAKIEREANLAKLKIDEEHNASANRVTGGLMALPPEQRAAAWPQALQELTRIAPDKAQALVEKYPQYPGDSILQQMHEFTISEAQRIQMNAQAQLKAHQDQTFAESARHNKESERIAEIAARRPNVAVIQQQNADAMAGFDPSQPLANPAAEALAHSHGSWEKAVPDAALSTRATLDQQKMVARANWLAINKYGHETGLPGTADVADMVANRKDYGPQGKSGQTIQAGATAARHLAYLDQLGDALKNGDKLAVNRIAQYFSKELGGAAPTNFQSVQSLVIPEVLRVAKGAGVINEKEEERLLAAVSKISSPEQLKGFTTSMVHIMGDRFKSMAPNYAKYNRGKDISERFDKEALGLFNKYGVQLGPQATPGASNTPTGSPASPGATPPTIQQGGKTYYLYSDGKYYSQKPAGVP